MSDWRPIQLITLKQDFTHSMASKPVSFLRMFILLWAIAIVVLSWFVDNPYILAGIVAWEVLP